MTTTAELRMTAAYEAKSGENWGDAKPFVRELWESAWQAASRQEAVAWVLPDPGTGDYTGVFLTRSKVIAERKSGRALVYADAAILTTSRNDEFCHD